MIFHILMRLSIDAEKGLEIGGVGIGIDGRNRVNVRMTRYEIRILEKIDTTTETAKKIETERETGKEIMAVIVIEVVIESEKEIIAGILSAALVTVTVRGITLGSGSALVMIRIVVMLMKEMLIMIMLMWHMIGIVKVLKQGKLIMLIQTVIGSIMMALLSTEMKRITVNITNRKSSSMIMSTMIMDIMERKVVLIIRVNTNVQSLNHLRRERHPGIMSMSTAVPKDPSPASIATDDLCLWLLRVDFRWCLYINLLYACFCKAYCILNLFSHFTRVSVGWLYFLLFA